MVKFIQLTNTYQDAPTLVNVRNICYFYRQDAGIKHTVICVNGIQSALTVQEDFNKVKELIDKALLELDEKQLHDHNE
jgi:hypothetical protein